MSGFAPEEIFAALAAAGVDYVTVGGFAVIAHGVVRATVDVDIVPSPEPSNALRMSEALVRLDAHPAGEPELAVTADLLARDANTRFISSAARSTCSLMGSTDVCSPTSGRAPPRSTSREPPSSSPHATTSSA